MKEFFTYSSIKFDNLYLKWNFIRISLWKWKKWILFYEKSLSNIILIKNTKFYLFIYFYGCVCIYNLSNKKNVYIYICVCVCIIKKRVCIYIYIYVCVGYLDKYINATTWPPKQKFLALLTTVGIWKKITISRQKILQVPSLQITENINQNPSLFTS